MCTAISFLRKNHYFGRNLDLEYSYEEMITITPRRFPFSFRNAPQKNNHYAMIGTAYVVDEYPLYYDATNEHGLSMAGLHFLGNAYYPNKEGIAPFELIPYVLGQCKNVREAVELLHLITLSEIAFNKELPVTPLHWLLSDKKESVTAEPLKEGLKMYENPVGVLTNNPPFDTQLLLLQNYRNLTPKENEEQTYSRGLGGFGLPGDFSSVSRFVKAVFVKEHSCCEPSEELGQFFHILKSVEQPKGCVRLEKGKLVKTVYSSCCDTKQGIYYYTTYENSGISAVDMRKENLDGEHLICYPMIRNQKINWQN